MRFGRLPWRLQVLLVVVPAWIAVLAVVALVPSGPAVSEAAPPQATETDCLPYESPRSVDDLNRFVDTVRGSGEFLGADVGADTVLQDGRRLWVFGDTLRSRDFDGQRFVRNSMLVFDADCANVVLPADHGALIPDRDDGVGYWPMAIASAPRAGYDLVGVTAQRVSSGDTPGDASTFTNLGPSIAVFLVPVGQPPQLLDVVDVGPDSDDKGRPTWGAAAAAADGWLYLYGTASPEQKLVFGFSLSVARVRPDDLIDPSRWTYWDGKAWRKDPSAAQELIPADGGVSQTLSVFERDGTWYAVSKRDEFLGSDLVVWSAPRPTGPFTAAPPAAEIPSDVDAGRLRYMPLAHPDLLPEDGSVVVSYSRNDTDVTEVQDDPFLYRPRFLRIDLP